MADDGNGCYYVTETYYVGPVYRLRLLTGFSEGPAYSGIYEQGYDIPTLDCIQVRRPQPSKYRLSQQLGHPIGDSL